MQKEKLSGIRYNRFNEDYIIVPVALLKQMKYLSECKVEEEFQSERTKIFYLRKKEIFKHILNTIKEYNKTIDYIVIRKNHALYKELLINAKKMIDAEMIENAYQIALIEENNIMINAITKLKEEIQAFKQSKNGYSKLMIQVGIQIHYCEIESEYGQDVAEYIWQNDSLEDYYKVQNGSLPHEEDREVFLYDNGKIEEKILPEPKKNKSKTKLKTFN